MRKSLLILIFISSIVHGQWNQWNNTYTPYKMYSPIMTSFSFNVRAQAFFRRVDSLGFTLTSLQKTVYNNIFQRLQDSSLIASTRSGDKIVAIYAFPKKLAGDSSVCNMNILANQYNCIHYGNVTYSDSSIIGDGVSGYLKTGFVATSDSSIYKLNSAGLAVWSLYVGNGQVNIGTYLADRPALIWGGTPKVYTALHGNSGATPSFSVTSLGFGSINRVSAATYEYYRNGEFIGNPSAYGTSAALPNNQFFILARNNSNNLPSSYSDERLPFAVIKGGLTATEERMLFNILKLCLQELSINSLATKTVKPSGGDYTTVAGALAGITDATYGFRYNVLIYPATYNEVHLQMKNYVNLVGTNIDSCIINGSYSNNTAQATIQNNSTIEWSNITCDISNLTIKGTNVRYVIHDDGITGTKSISNCTLVHYGCDGANTYWGTTVWAAPDAFGHGFAGTTNSQTLNVINVTATGKRFGWASHTNTGSVSYSSYMNLTNCTFYSTSADPKYSFRIYYAYANGDIYTLNNCTIHNGFYAEGTVNSIGKILLTNTTYDTLYCQSGYCL